MTADAIAKMLGVDTSTVRRWQRARKVPKPLHLLAHILLTGDLGPIDSAWEGWSIRSGGLHSFAHRQPLTVSELQYLPFTACRVASLEATIRRLELELKTLSEARDQSPAKRQLENAIHRTLQLERMAELMAEEFARTLGECVSEFESAGGAGAHLNHSDAARAAEDGAEAIQAARDAARLVGMLCERKLASIEAGETARRSKNRRDDPGTT